MNQFSTYDQLSCGYGKRNQNEQKQCSKKKIKNSKQNFANEVIKSIEGTHILDNRKSKDQIYWISSSDFFILKN